MAEVGGSCSSKMLISVLPTWQHHITLRSYKSHKFHKAYMKYNCKFIINIKTVANKTSKKLYVILTAVRYICRHSLFGRRLSSMSNFVLNPDNWQHPDRGWFQKERQICKTNTAVRSYRTANLKTKLKFWKLRSSLRYALSHWCMKVTARTLLILSGLVTDTNKDTARISNGYK